MDNEEPAPRVALDLTHIVYPDESLLSWFLALASLTPILLMPAYAALTVQTREYVVLVMWAGQLACEAFNWVLKHIVQEDRPYDQVGNGYGFPSSHSQYMGFFWAFLTCHLYLRHRFASSGNAALDQCFRMFVYVGIACLSGAVAYSRYYLMYHSVRQVVWGFSIGVACGSALYMLAVQIPRRRPNSLLGRFKMFLLTNPVSTWCQLRDGWAVWPDAGREAEWLRWRSEWDVLRAREDARKNM
ncbi:hypothetical protein BD626DRAFT_464364 [Schizophyllum amplum]|uniref:Phosphatidic acid phosphatase type 2/haloperoxidase domain-containing protein n=1 Tax=Schizophyllum amplum TaxID=97359 RepID=A0A550BZG0_9AGAR|nr:hypothetical protein BD626DRAFT_464364 [Auriculariopsis ampla]